MEAHISFFHGITTGSQYDVTEVRAPNGMLVSRDTKYPLGFRGEYDHGGRPGILILDESDRLRNLGNVSDINTRWNDEKGVYETKVTANYGHVYDITNDKDGNVTAVSGDVPRFRSPRFPSQAGQARPFGYWMYIGMLGRLDR
jgi:hypothetical protein